jgi:hypothetical protein
MVGGQSIIDTGYEIWGLFLAKAAKIDVKTAKKDRLKV